MSVCTKAPIERTPLIWMTPLVGTLALSYACNNCNVAEYHVVQMHQ